MFGPQLFQLAATSGPPKRGGRLFGETPWVPAAGRGGAAAGLGLMACTTAVASSAFSSATRKRTKEWSAWLAQGGQGFRERVGSHRRVQATDDLAEYDPLVLGDPQTLHQRRQVPSSLPQFGLGSSHQRDLAARAMSRELGLLLTAPLSTGTPSGGVARSSSERGWRYATRRPLVRAPCEVGESTPRLLAVSSPPDARIRSRARARCRGRGAPLTSKRRAHLRCARAAIPS